MSKRFGVYTSNESPYASLMPYAVREQLGYKAQDAFNYFLLAGGEGLERRYTESAMHEHNSRTLRRRLQALEDGAECLREIVSLVRPYVKRGENLDVYPVHDTTSFETMEQVEKAARLGLKMTISICKNFGVDPRSGETVEKLAKEGDSFYRSKPFWYRGFSG